jgi:hypothetical protein
VQLRACGSKEGAARRFFGTTEQLAEKVRQGVEESLRG